MKLTKVTCLLAIGLAMLLATGCKKTPTKTTYIPGQRPGNVGGLQPTDPIQGAGAQNLIDKTGGIPTADWSLDDYTPNREAFAAHTVHFDFDSYVVKSGEKQHVQAVAAALATDTAAKLLIEGHCDERGTEEYNRALGERRALALREALALLGADPMRIRTESFGVDKPVATGHDESAWKQNRRGEFILMHPK